MFEAIQIAYWLALSTWFGGVFFVAVALPIIFHTVRDADPTLPKVLSVNLESQHSTVLASLIASNLLRTLVMIHLLCAGVLILAIGAQWFFIDISGGKVLLAILRSAMTVAAAALLVYDWRVVWPRVQKFRQEYLDHADEPEIANPALDRYDKYQQESFTILRAMLFLLLGIILFSGNIYVAVTTFKFQ